MTNPNVKILDDPLIEVIELECEPPVQDSTKAIFNLFLLYNLTNVCVSSGVLLPSFIALTLLARKASTI